MGVIGAGLIIMGVLILGLAISIGLAFHYMEENARLRRGVVALQAENRQLVKATMRYAREAVLGRAEYGRHLN